MDEKKLTDKQNFQVYNVTTKPKKPKRRDKSDLGDNFIAPDGGWAWLVCIAAGFSNLCVFPSLQQFGLIFRDRLFGLGLNGSQITTIINTQVAVAALTGLVNGAMYRRFSFRQVAITGAFCIFSGIFFAAFANTFIEYIIFFSVLFGFGMGINMSAASLAVNTYFKLNRRRAMGFSWTITGLGPIILPHICTAALAFYGVQGTVIIFAGISLHSLVCSLVYQPVKWHTTPKPAISTLAAAAAKVSPELEEAEYQCKFCQNTKKPKRGIFSSQYLFQDDDAEKPGFEIIEPGTPMLSRANDGWFGSKLSLTSEKHITSQRKYSRSLSRDIEDGHRLRKVPSNEELKTEKLSRPNYFNREKNDFVRYASKVSLVAQNGDLKCTCAEEKALLQKEIASDNKNAIREEEKKKTMSFGQKIITFFDLDLLKDFTFVNLVVGLTVIMFGELNFSILTPFILNNFGLSNSQISFAMSLIGLIDIIVRFVGPFLTEKVSWDNRVLFVFGAFSIIIGRSIVAMRPSYTVILIAFGIIGFGKGFRTIFGPLLIPSYVPLKRLPGASGLQLIFNGIFTFSCGPIIGLITDATSYSVTLHVIDALSCLAILSWGLEALIRKQIKSRKNQKEEEQAAEMELKS